MANITVNQLLNIVDWMSKKFNLDATKIEFINDNSNGDVILLGRDFEKEIMYQVHYNPAHYHKSVFVEISYYFDMTSVYDKVFG